MNLKHNVFLGVLLLNIACGAVRAHAEANLATGKNVTASSQWNDQYAPALAIDGNPGTRWSAAGGKGSGEWLEVDFGAVVQFNQTLVKQYGECIQAYRIQYWNGTAWRDAFRGGHMASEQMDVFASVTASRARLLIVASQDGVPSVLEFEVNDNPAAPGANTMPAAPQNLAAGKPVMASSLWSDEYAPGKAVDGDLGTRWSAETAEAQWLEVDLGSLVVFNTITVLQYGKAISKYRIEYWDGEKWHEAQGGFDMPAFLQVVVQPVTASKVRLTVDLAKAAPSIYEMEVLNDSFAGLMIPAVVPKAQRNQPAEQEITINANDQGRTFEGIGVLSAGGNTDLLKDYPEPYRSDVLDYLFKPKFGAGFQHLKVEIGGGENSTCGSEPSHAITKEENANPKPRGFEFWMMHEARKRNPKILLDCLPWSYPAWCGGAFTQNSADWYVSFLNCARKTYGLELDYVGAGWNEKGTDRDWVVNMLRPSLNKAGYSKVKLQGPDDNSDQWKVFEQFETDSAYRDALDAVSYHIYGLPAATEKAKKSGKPLWMSECTGSGGLNELRSLIKFYVRDRITKYITWPPAVSCYEGLSCYANVGFVEAYQPWSGHYAVRDGVWYAAHVTQFTEPGWKLLDSGCKLFNPEDPNSEAGCLVLKDPKSDQWSLIAGTRDSITLKVILAANLSSGPIHVWKSGGKSIFIKQENIVPKDGSFTLKMEANSAYSLTTTTGQQKGEIPHPIPPAARFPAPYSEDFESYEAGVAANYLMDQKGTFEVADDGRGGKALKQIVPAEGTKWSGFFINPNTIFGDNFWESYELSAEVRIADGNVEIGGRHDDMAKLGYRLTLEKSGDWKLSYHTDVLASGAVAGFDGNAWHKMKIGFNRTEIKAFIDNAEVTILSNETKSMQGRCFLASSYHPNLFDNISVKLMDSPLDRRSMKASATSCHGPGYEADKVLDGDRATVWHSAKSSKTQNVQAITIDLGGTFEIAQVSYLPRQNNQSGIITSYNLLTSLDGKEFKQVAAGSWKKDVSQKVVGFSATKAAYIKLEAIAAVGDLAAAAEFNVYASRSGEK